MICERCGVEVNEGKQYCAECEKYEKSSKVKGILSLALSGAAIIGVLPLIGAVAGIIFGALSKGTKGEKLGQAGTIVGIIGVFVGAIEYLAAAVLYVAALLCIVIYFAFIYAAMVGGTY